MEKEMSCADCLNLGRAIYCMQCIRMNKGRKDMFISAAPTKEVVFNLKQQEKPTVQPAKI